MWNRKVFIRVVEVIYFLTLLCIACVVTLRITDDESRRVLHYLRSRSREWSLLNNVTWGTVGAALATVTCGGYVIITTGLLIAATTGELRGRKTEVFLLGLGVILFAIVGALSLASIEDVPNDLVDNAAIFGTLCLLTALVFIADLLMKAPKRKDEKGMRYNLPEKDLAKREVMTTIITEKESKTNGAAKPTERKDNDGNVNDAFEKMDDQERKSFRQEDPESPKPSMESRQDRPSVSSQRGKDDYEERRNRNYAEREHREYAQNFENGRALRESQRFRDAEMQRSGRRDSYDTRRVEDSRMVYKAQDIYQRPVDEVDTPRFPTEVEGRGEPVFAKIVNPGIKIMRVERDVDEAFDTYRFSDTSQYDNVPIRMRGSPGILKKNRDVSFNVPPAPKGYGKGIERTKNEIEMLEECFGILKTATTGTQTGVRTPSSPTDPGYVRHTASNWPHELKTKTPGSSPDHTTNK